MEFSYIGRLFEADLLDESIERILHNDCDTVVNGNLSQVYNLNIENVAVAGVLLFNLKYMRENNIVDRFISKIKSSSRLLYLDQDVLNCCLSREE